MKIKFLSIAVVLLTIVLALAGCGTPEPEIIEIVKEVPVEVVKEVEVPVEVEVIKEVEVPVAGAVYPGPVWEPPDLSGREFLIWGLEYDPHVRAYYRLAEKFAEYTGVKFTVQPQGWPIEDNVITGMAAGVVPDAVCIMGRQISPLVDQGVLQELDGMYEEMGVDLDTWFSPVARDAYTRRGKIYGVPTEGNATSGVVNVRLDALADSGVEDLWPPNQGRAGFDSFDEMWTLASKMVQVDDAGNVTRWGLSGEGWYANQFLGILLTLGGEYYDPATDTVNLVSSEALEAMDLLAVKPIFDLGIETQLGMGGQENMNAGKVAMAAGNVTGTSSGLFAVDPPIYVDTCLYPPAIPGEEPIYVGEGGWGFVATTQGENPDVALEFMKFLTTYEGNKTYCEIYGGIVSAVNVVNNDEELFPPGTLLGESMARGGLAQEYTIFYDVGDHNPVDVVRALGTAIEAVRVGDMSPAEALAMAQAQVEEAFALD